MMPVPVLDISDRDFRDRSIGIGLTRHGEVVDGPQTERTVTAFRDDLDICPDLRDVPNQRILISWI